MLVVLAPLYDREAANELPVHKVSSLRNFHLHATLRRSEAANEFLVDEARSYINSSCPCELFATMPLIPTSKSPIKMYDNGVEKSWATMGEQTDKVADR